MSDDHQQRPPPLPPSARPPENGCAVALMAIAGSIMLLPAICVLASGDVRTWFVHPFSQDTVMLFGPALVGIGLVGVAIRWWR